MKVGDIVRVNECNSYYMAVITDINEKDGIICVKDITKIEYNFQPIKCIEIATEFEIADELRSLYGFYD